MIKNIIFDNGSVLCEPRTGHWLITPKFWDIVGNDEKENVEKIKSSMKNYGHIVTQQPKTEEEEYEMFVKAYYQFLKDYNYKNLSKKIAEELAFDNVYNDDKYIFYDDVDDCLDKLSKEYDLYMVTDAWASTFRVLDNRNISKYFKNITVSAMESKTKLEGLFEVFLEKNKDINPLESVFIDDRIDILDKAYECGFNVLLMDRKNKYNDCKYPVIHQLSDIEKFIS